MIERYSIPEMKKIWSEESKYESWFSVELNVLKAYQKYNSQITNEDIEKIEQNHKIDIDRIKELEAETKHDVIAFTRALSETLGPEKKWIHYGLTSTDVVDTAQSYRIKQANSIIEKQLIKLIESLKIQAIKYRDTFQMGRTHGVHAEVTTWGYKIALWFDEMQRNLKRFQLARKNIEVAKISGAVGNYANIPLSVQEDVAKALGLNSSLISTQTLQRDRHAEYFFTLTIIGLSLNKFAIEIRNLQRTEIKEVMEGFSKNQKGSSAMPHKKNPIGSENISGCSRILKGYLTSALDNVSLWHERDISHSAVERVILPDATQLLAYMLQRFDNIFKNLVVDEEKMLSNINLTQGVIFSQRVMLFLINEKGMTREDAYDLVQPLSNLAIGESRPFKELLIDKQVLNSDEANSIFNLDYYLTNIKQVFKRLGLA